MSRSEIFAGIAVFPVEVDSKYNVCVSLVSSKGRAIKTTSTSSPVCITSLTETVGSLIASILPDSPARIKTYVTSVPPTLLADVYYDIFSALDSAKLIDENRYPDPPLNHGEVWAVGLPKGTTALMVLDFTTPAHLYAASLISRIKRGKRITKITHEFRESFTDTNSLQDTLQKIAMFQEETDDRPKKIVLIKSASTLTVNIDVDGLVERMHSSVPVSIATFDDISQAAASFAYADSLLPVHHTLAISFSVAPVCVATASGRTVLLTPSGYANIDSFVIFTNSVDNQKSVTVRLLIGNHPLEKDNLQRGVAVLNGLNPLLRGDARIMVWIRGSARPKWRETVEVVVRQKDGPLKTFLFSRFFTDLPKEYRKHEISVKHEEGILWSEDSEVIMGELPE